MLTILAPAAWHLIDSIQQSRRIDPTTSVTKRTDCIDLSIRCDTNDSSIVSGCRNRTTAMRTVADPVTLPRVGGRFQPGQAIRHKVFVVLVDTGINHTYFDAGSRHSLVPNLISLYHGDTIRNVLTLLQVTRVFLDGIGQVLEIESVVRRN
jgi:hypothetical protein